MLFRINMLFLKITAFSPPFKTIMDTQKPYLAKILGLVAV